MKIEDKVDLIKTFLQSENIPCYKRWFNPKAWKSCHGEYQYTNPEWGIEFYDKSGFEKAWSLLSEKGKEVFVSEGRVNKSINQWILVDGIYAIKNTCIKNAFSGSSETSYLIKFRGSSVFRGTWFERLKDQDSTLNNSKIDVQKVITQACLDSIKEIVENYKAN